MASIKYVICCVWLMLPLIPIALILVLAFALGIRKGPRCYIQELYVPALDLSLGGQFMTSNSSTLEGTIVNPSLFFDLALRNGMRYNPVRYDNINLTFSYGGNNIGSFVVPSFFQRKKSTVYKREVVETHGVPWNGVLGQVANGSKVVFQVELATRVRIYAWDASMGTLVGTGKTRKVRVGTNVEVDGSGMKVGKGWNRLNSAAPKPGVGLLVLLMFVFNLTLIKHI